MLYKSSGMIIDCGRTAVSLRFFAGVLGGALGIIALLWFVVREDLFPASGTLFLLLLFSAVALSVLRDRIREGIVITPTVLMIMRPFNRPVIVPADTIVAVQVQKNVPPVSLRFQKILALAVLPVSSAVIVCLEYQQLAQGGMTVSLFITHLVFYTGIVMLFLSTYYHALIRASYAETLVITTSDQRLVSIYAENLQEIAGMLEWAGSPRQPV